MTELEKRLGYTFKDASLLDMALTSPACRMDRPDVQDNQRLEFLGDAVIGFMAADMLYRTMPNESEGRLTVRRTHMVSGSVLAKAAERVGVRDFLKRNAAAAELAPLAKPLADAMEAIMGAAWLDGGLPAAQKVFESFGLGSGGDVDDWTDNPKGCLQVLAQGMKRGATPRYELVERKGPDHAPEFTVRVVVKGVGEAQATAAGNLKAAEAAAALKMIEAIKER